MPKTIIDELIVTLSLDPKKFTAGQKKAVDELRKLKTASGNAAEGVTTSQGRAGAAFNKGAKTSAAASKTVIGGQDRIAGALRRTETQATRTATTLASKGPVAAEFFTGMTEAALGFGAALVGIKSIQDAVGVMNNTAALGRAAANAGIKPSTLSAFGLAVSRYAGGSASAASGSLAGLVSNVEGGLVSGQYTPQMALLSRLGVSLQTAMHNPMEAMRQLNRAFSKMPKPQANAYGRILGLDQGSINLLEQPVAAFNRHIKAVMPDAVTKEQTAAMIKLQTAFYTTTQDVEALGRAFLTKLAPALEIVLKTVDDTLGWFSKGAPVLKGPHTTIRDWRNPYAANMRHNPGNLRSAPGVTSTGGFANFPTEKAGIRAMGTLLQKYPSRYGADTISSIINRYAPASDGNNDAAYIANVSRWTGFGPNQKLNLQNPLVLGKLVTAMSRQEGHRIGSQAVFAALGSKGGPSSHTLPPSVTDYLHHLRAAQPGAVTNNHHSHSETHIGTVTVNTKASDAKGVASAIKHIGTPANLASQANRGMF